MTTSIRHLRISALAIVFAASAAAQLSFTPFRATGIYDVGEKAGWNLSAPAGARYRYVVRRNNLDTVKSGSLDFTSGTATIEATLPEPGMLYVEITPDPPPSDKAKPIHLGAAIAPAKLNPVVPRPADFDQFWEAKLDAQRAVPMMEVITRIPAAKPGIEFYTFQINCLNSHAQGYIAKPEKEGKFPALVILQWAGVYALPAGTPQDYAAKGWLVLNVDSHDKPPTQPDGPPRDYFAVGNTSRETSYFLNMYLRDARALDYLATRPDWDGKTVVLLGTSMGGQQSLVTAALSPIVTAVIVNEPAGADSNGDAHGRKTGYPNWAAAAPKSLETALYFDTVNFAPRIKAPVLMAVGFIDTVVPPAGVWTAFNQIPGPKEMISMIESDHNNLTPDKQGAFTSRSSEVLDTILHGGAFTPSNSTK